ncbi:MAG: replication initiator protein A [Lachnospiraceae bacterium]|nr:replication initiator protein A [Lachnospiraceae bacterium]
MRSMKMNYFYGAQADQYNFIKIPKELVVGEGFSSLSVQAKILYGMLLDRMGMSYKNKWLDEENRVYIVYSLDDIQSDMNVSKHKAIDCLSELEDVGLIVRRKRGKGLPNQIYVKNFSKAQVVASV